MGRSENQIIEFWAELPVIIWIMSGFQTSPVFIFKFLDWRKHSQKMGYSDGYLNFSSFLGGNPNNGFLILKNVRISDKTAVQISIQ